MGLLWDEDGNLIWEGYGASPPNGKDLGRVPGTVWEAYRSRMGSIWEGSQGRHGKHVGRLLEVLKDQHQSDIGIACDSLCLPKAYDRL